MQRIPPADDNARLREALREWRVEAGWPARFQEGVWRRIERGRARAAPSAWTVIAHWVGTVLPRPALAASYIVALFIAGAAAGFTQGRQESARVKDELGRRYVQVSDPYQMPHR